MRENSLSAEIELDESDLEGINRILETFEVKGGRYMAVMDGLQAGRV